MTKVIIHGMKKIFLGFLVLSVLALTGCGVKSELKRPGDFPRNYPVY
jgi:predicted small lipoprotein YifL